jgi:hypothetical protein
MYLYDQFMQKQEAVAEGTQTLFVNIQLPGENTVKLGTNPTYSFESLRPDRSVN